jgi:hypothetical protein
MSNTGEKKPSHIVAVDLATVVGGVFPLRAQPDPNEAFLRKVMHDFRIENAAKAAKKR